MTTSRLVPTFLSCLTSLLKSEACPGRVSSCDPLPPSTSFLVSLLSSSLFGSRGYTVGSRTTRYTENMAEPEVERRASTSGDEAEEERLAQFGYKQELKRDWG